MAMAVGTGAFVTVVVQPAAASVTGAPAPSTDTGAAAAADATTVAPSSPPTGEPTGAATTEPPASATPTLTPSPSATPSVSKTPKPTPTKTRTASPSPTAVPRTGTPAAVEESDISLTTGTLAVLALLIAGAALWASRRADRKPAADDGELPPIRAPSGDTAVSVAFLVELGTAMIDSGYTVTQVQVTLGRVLQVNGVVNGQVLVMPTGLLVSVPGRATVETAVAAAGWRALRLDQVDAVSRTVTAAETGAVTPSDGLVALRRANAQAPPYGPAARTAGYAVLSTGLALILQGTALDVVVAATLGAVVGALQLMARGSGPAARAVLPFLAAFVVAVSVFVLGRVHEDVGVLPALIAPLVTFLPGALLTTGVIELSTGQMISGAGRLASGVLQLVMLALGIASGAKLVGVASSSVEPLAAAPLGDVGPWIGVALFGAGVAVYHCARMPSLGWIILVLYVAYGAQIIGGVVLGPVLSAFVGALVMSPVAAYVARLSSGPPLQVSFLPAFWLLVPGALGLVGVTQLLGANRVDAVTGLLSMGTTMIGISFGVLIGLALGATVDRRLSRPAPVHA
jgi:uncharacterized membrane protein YjjP (DUF1212 family)